MRVENVSNGGSVPFELAVARDGEEAGLKSSEFKVEREEQPKPHNLKGRLL